MLSVRWPFAKARRPQPRRPVSRWRRAFLESLEDRRVMANVAVFDNGAYVDTTGGSSAESDAIQASLAALGHTVSTFTATDAAGILTALAGQDVVLFPEFENGSPASALDAQARGALANFVASGGGLVISRDYTSFLNTIFGFSLVEGTAGTSAITGAAVGTQFVGGPLTLPANNLTMRFNNGSLPGGTRSIYSDLGGSIVSLIPFGTGQIVHLGWDWFNSAPLGSVDGGWGNVLNSAVRETAGSIFNPSFEQSPDFTGWTVTLPNAESVATVNRSNTAAFRTDGSAGAVLKVNDHSTTPSTGVAGPIIRSISFPATAGDRVSVDWRVIELGDRANARGFLRRFSDDAIVGTFFDFFTPTTTSGTTNFATATVTVPATGSYYIDFQSGTFDTTGGGLLGAELRVDNVVTNRKPVITLAGSTGTELDSDNQNFSWLAKDHDGNLATTSVTVTRDAASVFTSTDAGGLLDFNSFGIGTFVLTVTATDSSGNSTTATRTVTVNDDDPSPPTIVLGGPFGTQSDSLPPGSFTWDISDAGSGLGSFLVEIKRDTVTLFSTTTVAVGSFNLAGYGLGTFTMTATATDADADWTGDAATNTATRTATFADDDDDGPAIVLGGSIGGENDGQTQNFTWNVSDFSGLSALFIEIKRDGLVIFSTTGLGAAIGSFNFDSHGLGTYTIAVSATDADNDRPGDMASSAAGRTVIVTDDDTTSPVITLTGSSGSETDGQTQAFTWNVTDPESATQLAVSVQIFQTGNPTPIHTSTNSTGTFNFDALGLGTFTINVSATSDSDWTGDSLSSSGTRTVIVVDDDTDPPTIVLGGSTGAETDGQTQNFTWNVSDFSGLSSLLVVIQQDGNTIYSTALLSDAVGSFNFDTYGLGTFTINVSATDADNDRLGDSLSSSASRSVVVTDDDTDPPLIVIGGSTGTETDIALNEFTWSVTDFSGLSALSIVIQRNGITIYSTTNIVDAVGSYNFDGPGLGTYTIAISATDADNDRANDSLSSSATGQVIVITAGVSGGAESNWFRVRASSTSKPNGEVKVFTTVKTGTKIVETFLRKFTTSEAIIINGNGGNDTIEVMGTLTRGVRFFGGPDNDVLVGGNAGDVLVGNNGLDVLTGNLGRDLLIGGRDVDRLFGGKASGNTDKKDENILVGDDSRLAVNDSALVSLITEWNSLRSSTSPSNSTRVGNLRSTINAAALADDGAADQMYGTAALTWFWDLGTLNEKMTGKRSADWLN
ncbi:MAG: hypothetical protein SFU86_11585 [Pirellulaceae bacterium]|nr:hypothetical protein [Pirellulaceae bacterium]